MPPTDEDFYTLAQATDGKLDLLVHLTEGGLADLAGLGRQLSAAMTAGFTDLGQALAPLQSLGNIGDSVARAVSGAVTAALPGTAAAADQTAAPSNAGVLDAMRSLLNGIHGDIATLEPKISGTVQHAAGLLAAAFAAATPARGNLDDQGQFAAAEMGGSLETLIGVARTGLDCICEAVKGLTALVSGGLSHVFQTLGVVPKAFGETQPLPAPPSGSAGAGAGGGGVPNRESQLFSLREVFANIQDTLARLVAASVEWRRAAENVNAWNKQFAGFRPDLMMTFVQQDIQRLLRTFEFAQRTAPSAIGLADTVERMREAWFGFDVFVQNQWNRFGQLAGDLSTITGTMASRIANIIERAFPGLTQGRITDQFLNLVDPRRGDLFAFGRPAAGEPGWIGALRNVLERFTDEGRKILDEPVGRRGPYIDPGTALLWNAGFGINPWGWPGRPRALP